MALISVPFDEAQIYAMRAGCDDAFEITLPEQLDEEVWERLLVIKELAYPYPLVVTFSLDWLERDLEAILTRLAVSAVSGIKLQDSVYKPHLARINETHRLGLFIISK